MSSSFELPAVERFTTGTVGPPGQRVFFIQGSAAGQVVSLRLEKLQVAALAEYLAEILAALPAIDASEVDDADADLDLLEPVVAEWVVGSLAVAADEAGDHVVIQAEELVDEEESALGTAATARFVLTRAQVAAFIVQAATVVAAGRPPCPLCGAPDGPDGHVCVKTNGHRER